MRLVDEHVDVVAGVGVLLDALELVDHGQDESTLVRFQQLAKFGPGARTPDRDVLLLHLAEQPFDPTPELSFELHPVHDHDYRGGTEPILSFEDQASGGQQREGLAGALRVPDEPAPLRMRGATLDDAVDRAALVLAEHGFSRLAVLDVKENPVPQGAKEVVRLEERLDREPVALLRALLPARHESARRIPGDAVPVVEEVGHVEELRRAHEFGGLLLVAPKLGDAAVDGIGVRRVLVLDDGDRHPVDEEHHIRPVALAGGGLELPLPSDMKDVGVRRLEVDETDLTVTLLGLVVPLPLATEPREHLAVALDRRRECIEPLDGRADDVLRHPGVEPPEGPP